jgi:hypothetical protein
VFTLRRIGHQQSFNAFQNRVLIEIVANDFGHIGIDRLVVGDSGPQRICEGYVSGAIGIKETLST